ncbi:MAG TPA: MerC domain-containing protein [Candidatus Melainabacteria bacterium]|jgi:hypothetical protein|nr:MerC domain-containing protein [Candidatus Melainabacteria bacterium]HIN64997.1 MerC domain-containing protein [Candidatus Obscuribacterales bacterium]
MFTTSSNCLSPSCSHKPAGIWDVFGMFAGLICLVHCLVLPFAIAALPALGLLNLENDYTHILLFAWVALFSISIFLGYKKHRQTSVLSLMFLGLCFVMTATFHHAFGVSESLEVPVISMGNLLLVLAHFMNRRISRQIQA